MKASAYVTPLKTVAVEAWQRTFDGDYPTEDFRSLFVDIEFPRDRQAYPSIWVDWEPVGALRPAGIGHKEYVEIDGGGTAEVHRWLFNGVLTFTAVALSSLERDRLIDEMIRVMSFGALEATTSEFWDHIENNGLVGVVVKKDEIDQRGWQAAPGTPWGSDDVVYEATLASECTGEYVSNPTTGSLVLLSAVQVTAYSDREPDPDPSSNWR